MLGGQGGDDPDTTRRMANLQVKSSFIQFLVAVGLINLSKKDFNRDKRFKFMIYFSSICSTSDSGRKCSLKCFCCCFFEMKT